MASIGTIRTARNRVTIGVPANIFVGRSVTWKRTGNTTTMTVAADGRSVLIEGTNGVTTLSCYDQAAPSVTRDIAVTLGERES